MFLKLKAESEKERRPIQIANPSFCWHQHSCTHMTCNGLTAHRCPTAVYALGTCWSGLRGRAYQVRCQHVATVFSTYTFVSSAIRKFVFSECCCKFNLPALRKLRNATRQANSREKPIRGKRTPHPKQVLKWRPPGFAGWNAS